MSFNVTVKVTGTLVENEMLQDATGIISFPASYAQFAFEGHGRNIAESSLNRRENAIKSQVVRSLKVAKDTRLAVEAATRTHLSEMRRFELNAPVPGPPARNPLRDRLRRITGNLSDTANVRIE